MNLEGFKQPSKDVPLSYYSFIILIKDLGTFFIFKLTSGRYDC